MGINTSIAKKLLDNLFAKDKQYGSAYLGKKKLDSNQKQSVISPIDEDQFATISLASSDQISTVISASTDAYLSWRSVPAPKRGELVRVFGEKIRRVKNELAYFITLESGKPWQESLGEVQELIDVCDFAVGLSRQLHGLTISTERKNHRMMEQWHPIGPVLIISAFNFPMAVWGWNAALALICGNSIIWKPSSQCPLSALSCHNLLVETINDMGLNDKLSSVIFGEKNQVEQLVDDRNIALVSATGSCEMGRAIGTRVASRLGRSLLELGGNNAMIICPSANLDIAIRAIVFSALGTNGQRCTSLRRLLIHRSLKEAIIQKLRNIYTTVKIGDPFNENNLLGPLISRSAVEQMQKNIERALQQGGSLIKGCKEIESNKGFYITPAIIEIDPFAEIVQEETFAPLLFIHSFSSLNEAIDIQNSVSQGLSSSIFTQDICEAELFLSATGSDCGIANVNIGTSGAEIGGAFGGEKDTGGGRESGSDAWKNYMRRCTNTINYGDELPLAQGISFDIPK